MASGNDPRPQPSSSTPPGESPRPQEPSPASLAGDVSPAQSPQNQDTRPGTAATERWVMSPNLQALETRGSPRVQSAAASDATGASTPLLPAAPVQLHLARQVGGGGEVQERIGGSQGAHVASRDVMGPIHLDRGVNCDHCQLIVYDVWTCAMCMVQGHRQCLNLQFIAGFAFCSLCSTQAQAAYQRHTEEQRARWLQSMSASVASWRQTIMTTSGAAASIGLAAGACTGALVAGAVAMAHGAASGAATTISGFQRAPSEPRALGDADHLSGLQLPPKLTAGAQQRPEEGASEHEAPVPFTSAQELSESDLVNGLPGASSHVGPLLSQGSGTHVGHGLSEGGETRERIFPASGVEQRDGPGGGGTHVVHEPEGPSSRTFSSHDPPGHGSYDFVGASHSEQTRENQTPTFEGQQTPEVCIACLAEYKGKGIPHLHRGTCKKIVVMLDAERAGHCLACHNGWHRRHFRSGNCRQSSP